MGLFKADFIRFFAFGFAAGAVLGGSAFVDLRLARTWDLELCGGGGAIATSLGTIGGGWGSIAAQYDPPSPLFVNLGVGAGYGSTATVFPDASVGFVW